MCVVLFVCACVCMWVCVVCLCVCERWGGGVCVCVHVCMHGCMCYSCAACACCLFQWGSLISEFCLAYSSSHFVGYKVLKMHMVLKELKLEKTAYCIFCLMAVGKGECRVQVEGVGYS